MVLNTEKQQSKLLTQVLETLEETFQELKVYAHRNISSIGEYLCNESELVSSSTKLSCSDRTTAIEHMAEECYKDLFSGFRSSLQEFTSGFKSDFGTISNKCVLGFNKQLKTLSAEFECFEKKLDMYFETKVKINEKKMELAQKKLFIFLDTLEDYFKKTWGKKYPTGKPVLRGSVADGTKVIFPNEFDIMLPLTLPNHVEYERPVPYLLKVKMKRATHRCNDWAKLSDSVSVPFECDGNNTRRSAYDHFVLSPEKVTNQLKDMLLKFQKDEEVVKKLCDEEISLQLPRSEHFYRFGPAIDVRLVYENETGGKSQFVLDIVPFIQDTTNSQHVIRPYYTEYRFIGGGKGGQYAEVFADPQVYWRISHSSHEPDLFEHLKDKIRKPLMIWKSIILLNTGLKNPILTSYHLKNISMLLAFERQDIIANSWQTKSSTSELLDLDKFVTKWASYPLGLQVIEMGKMFCKFLRTGRMSWCFHPEHYINFRPSNAETCKNHSIEEYRESLASYMEKIISSGNWCGLIDDCKLTLVETKCPFSNNMV
jgi:hypothetical protein